MSMNRIQFQRGLSMPEFQRLYGTHEQCEQALDQARWPAGWRCDRCACTRFANVHRATGKHQRECFVCGYQSSSTVGTVFEHTKLPLNLWFLAMYELTQGKSSVSALELKRRLGVSYKTAWLIKHKLLKVMQLRDEPHKLEGRVEIDDAYLGGERQGSVNGGRGALNKTAFVAAVQTNAQGHPVRMRMKRIAGFTNEAFRAWAAANLSASAHVVSDGTACFRRVVESGATHERYVTGSGRAAAQLAQFRWVNTALGNVKTAITGTFHSIKHEKYADRYLAEFCYRFNRRFDLRSLLPRLLNAAAATKPHPMTVIRMPDACI